MFDIIHGDRHLANSLYNNSNREIAVSINPELSTIGDPLLNPGSAMPCIK
jgi:aminoglycoside phosphotransferase (APT) family kinase protein